MLEQAQVVDGLWTTAPQKVANALYGYDRVVALGSPDSTVYEVTVPVTVHSIGPAAGSFNSGAALVGLGLRWQGHTIQDKKQPAWGYKKAGSYVWQRVHSAPKSLRRSATVVIRGRLRRGHGPGTPVHVQDPHHHERWDHDAPVADVARRNARAFTWEVQIAETDAPVKGSVVLIAHQLKATFGVVTVTATSP